MIGPCSQFAERRGYNFVRGESSRPRAKRFAPEDHRATLGKTNEKGGSAAITRRANAAHHVQGEAPSGLGNLRRPRLRGSIAIDRDLLDASGILAHEQVDVSNVNSGARWTTYVNEAPRVSRAIAVNGPGARLVQKGDKVIIIACCQVPAEEARNYRPSIVVLGEGNAIERVR
jgi:aspartate 1-decarboxylase